MQRFHGGLRLFIAFPVHNDRRGSTPRRGDRDSTGGFYRRGDFAGGRGWFSAVGDSAGVRWIDELFLDPSRRILFLLWFWFPTPNFVPLTPINLPRRQNAPRFCENCVGILTSGGGIFRRMNQNRRGPQNRRGTPDFIFWNLNRQNAPADKIYPPPNFVPPAGGYPLSYNGEARYGNPVQIDEVREILFTNSSVVVVHFLETSVVKIV